jgi:hypothetical protein
VRGILARSAVEVSTEEVDGDVDDGLRDHVAGVRHDGELAVGQPAVGEGGILDGAEVVAVAGDEQRRRRDRSEVVERVAR